MTRQAILLVPAARTALKKKKFIKARTLSRLLMNTCPKCNRKLEKKREKKVISKATKYQSEIVAYPIIWICPVHGEIESKLDISPSLAGQILHAMEEWNKYTHTNSQPTWKRKGVEL